MSKSFSNFNTCLDSNDVFTAQSGKLSCIAVRLSNGGFCLYSPVPGLPDEAYTKLQQTGDVFCLLAPNHYHNRGLAENVRRFPNANLYCSSAAYSRLSKVTKLVFENIKKLSKHLPSHIRMLEPEGLKTGEVWFEIEDTEDLVWVVTDAFSSDTKQGKETTNKPSMLSTFPKYGIADHVAYKTWVKERLKKRPPTILIPCHGQPVRCRSLGKLLGKLLKA